MRLLLIQPEAILLDMKNVSAITIPTLGGNLGILPRRLDSACGITMGIMSYRIESGKHYAAVDDGVLVKCGDEVRVAVHQAMIGDNLEQLEQVMQTNFRKKSEQQQLLYQTLSRLESAMIRQMAAYARGK